MNEIEWQIDANANVAMWLADSSKDKIIEGVPWVDKLDREQIESETIGG